VPFAWPRREDEKNLSAVCARDAYAPNPRRAGHALPLGGERKWDEETIETQAVAEALAAGLNLDFDCAELTGLADQAGTKVSAYLSDRAKALWAAREAKPPAADAVTKTWEQIAKLLWAWDAQIQDALAAESFAVASGYQLGRGLAETYWANDPEADGSDNPQSWDFLLGPERVDPIRRLQRLSAYFLPMTAPAIEASLLARSDVAKDKDLRSKPGTFDALHGQVRVWHDLLLTRQPPESLIKGRSVLVRARRIRPVLRAFAPELGIGLASVAAAAAAAGLFAAGGGNRALAGVLAVLGFFGVTGSSALAKAKDEAHNLFADLRAALAADLVKQAVTVPPARPPARGLITLRLRAQTSACPARSSVKESRVSTGPVRHDS